MLTPTSRLLRLTFVGLNLFALAGLANGQEGSPTAPPQGFESLLNGRDLSGWHGRQRDLDPRKWNATTAEQREQWNDDMRKHWRIADGVLINDGEGVYATTNEEFGDMELLIEYHTVAKADSGIYLRATPQVQIWDSTNESQFGLGSDKGSGGLWNNSPGAAGKDPLVLADKPFGEWNSFRIVQVGARTSVWLNGQQVVDHAKMENYWDRKEPLLRKGPIQLQTHGGEIQWRNIFVRKLDADQANAWLREHDRQQYKSLFNGRDLSGWAGAVDSYEVVEDAIRCQQGKNGVLHTSQEYGDFRVRFEFQLPAGGNSGLAIRYPGQGDTAYVGMCELQILDDSAERYRDLDPRQFHGSAYGMIAAKRGYLRDIGDWNFQQVTVVGSTIQVELNGTMILDGDLSEVTQFMADSPHPGKDRTRGYFGFAGHNDAVRFRNIEIAALDGPK